MAKSVKKYEISEIREFTKRNQGKTSDISPWIPSLGSNQNFKDTFTLEGKNVIPATGQVLNQSSKGEINVLTNFKQQDSNDINLKRFYLFLYCLRHSPYFFSNVSSALNYSSDDFLFTQVLQNFLLDYQTGKTDENFSKSLVADIVRTYRGTKLKESLDNENSIQSFLDYARRPNGDYQRNVAGVLGRVTYDSIVKHTLYSLLLKGNIVTDFSKPLGATWSELAINLNTNQFDLFVDVNGGPYKRAFPVICVYTKASSGKKIDDLIEDSNKFIESKFYRKPNSKNQLVTEIKVGNEKNFVESPVSLSGDSVYCIIYDYAKVIVLDPSINNDYTLSLLKIGLSLLARKSGPLYFKDVSEFKSFYEQIKSYLEDSILEDYDKLKFEIVLKNKHTKECEYILNKPPQSLTAKISKSFGPELSLLFDSITNVYEKIISIFNNEVKDTEKQNFQFKNYNSQIDSPIILHFDNFYNLLAVTSVNISPNQQQNPVDETLPFIIEDYKINFGTNDLVAKFFKDSETLPKFAEGKYTFSPSIALDQDIVLITDTFIKQLYYNLDNSSKDFVYEIDENQNEDNVLLSKPFRLLELIQQRTDILLKKEDYFFISSNNLYLRKEIVRKLELKELEFLFESVKEDKIKLQTIGHFLFISKRKENINLDDFANDIYYPKIIEVKSPKPDDPPPPPPETQKKPPPKDNNYLINNIISSELKCYEDIANSFDKALNAESLFDKLYFVGKTLVLIGLPFLLSYAAQQVADKLAKLSKNKVNPGLLECLAQDSENLRKMVLGAADIATSTNTRQLLLQSVPTIPELPKIPYLPIFDLEKELKRRIVEAIIKEIIKRIKDSIGIAIQPIIDMCNSDSYLTAFINSAIPNLDNLNNKLASSTPSGLVGGSNSTVYVPNLIANINELIEQSGIESLQTVYELFRNNYFVKKEDYTDSEISDFFDYISEKIDAGQMLSLLKVSSAPQTRNFLLSYIKSFRIEGSQSPYKFSVLIDDEQEVGSLFLFLSRYIDYRLIFELISSSLNDFSPSVCIDIESRFDELSSTFNENQINDQAIDLENSLADICSLKNKLVFDIFANGPAILTTNLSNALNIGFNSVVDSLEKTSVNKTFGEKQGSINTGIYSVPVLNINEFIASTNLSAVTSGNKPDPYIGVKPPNKDKYYNLFFTNDSGILNASNGPNDSLYYFANLKTIILDSITLNINDVYEERKKKYKQIFNNELKNSGNIGLKTSEEVFSSYIQKYNELKGTKIY